MASVGTEPASLQWHHYVLAITPPELRYLTRVVILIKIITFEIIIYIIGQLALNIMYLASNNFFFHIVTQQMYSEIFM